VTDIDESYQITDKGRIAVAVWSVFPDAGVDEVAAVADKVLAAGFEHVGGSSNG
jgi:hypothetical protein